MAHISVLLQESIKLLDPKTKEIIVDGTIGSGGHSLEIIKKSPDVFLIGLDKDSEAIKRSEEILSKTSSKFSLHKSDFRNFDKVLKKEGVEKIDGLLLDLGLNSEQLENSGRGFSFMKDEPLLMTFENMESENLFSAKDILNTWSEESIKNIIFGYGEEKYAGKIAKAIVTRREDRKFETTKDLVDVIKEVVPLKYRNGKTHFATKTFQALRIAVNDELEGLKEALQKSIQYLNPQGRVVVISFHSLEDRVVKNFFKNWEKENLGKILTKKPTYPTEEEISINPRSRSAKLRAFIKNENNY